MYLIQNFAILGGDRRQYHLAAQLMAAGFSVACYQVPDLPDTHASLHDALAQAEAVLLPVPALRDAAHIKSPGDLPLDAVRACLPPGARIFGGVLPEELFAGHVQYDYMRDEPLAVQNAALTAEAAVALALGAMPTGLSVASRKAEDRAWCAALGYRPEQTHAYAHGLTYDCVLNTVPAPVFTEAQLATLRCPLVDLASAPGGLPPACDPPKLYQRAPGLPGRFAPERAARILKETTLRILSEEQEALWNP